MTAPDVPDCVSILREHDQSQDAHEWAARLGRDVADADKRPVVAVVDDDVVAGYARTLHFHRENDSPPEAAPGGWYLLGLVVASAHRERGIGRLLTEERLRWLVERGAPGVYFFTDIENIDSQRLHEQVGFRRLSRGFWFPTLPPEHAETLYYLNLPAAESRGSDSHAPANDP